MGSLEVLHFSMTEKDDPVGCFNYCSVSTNIHLSLIGYSTFPVERLPVLYKV